VRWRVPGSIAPYVKSLEPLLKDPSVYVGGNDHRDWGLIQDFYRYRDLEKFPYFDVEEFLRMVTPASNPEVLLFWLNNFGVPMDERHSRRFGQLLDFPNQRIQFEVATALASRLQEPTQTPKRYGTVDGSTSTTRICRRRSCTGRSG